MNIILIDDEQAILDAVYLQLMDMNLGMDHIDRAGSARAARELFRTRKYEIALCDIVMPGEDGISFARWATEHSPGIKIVFLTAHADYDYMKQAIAMKSFEYLLQPASREDLKNVVMRAMSEYRIEEKNRQAELFFQNREDSILEAGTVGYLKGEQEDESFMRMLLNQDHVVGEWIYIPIIVQILETSKDLEKMDPKLLRMIYTNITDEIFRDLEMHSLVLLLDGEGDYASILCVRQNNELTREELIEKLELLAYMLKNYLSTETAIYYSKRSTAPELRESFETVWTAMQNNVMHKSGVIRGSMRKGEVPEETPFARRGVLWKNLLNNQKFEEFYSSIFTNMEVFFRSKEGSQGAMLKIHQVVTEILLNYMVEHGLSSADVFDQDLPYLKYLNAWISVDEFRAAVEHIMFKFKELSRTELMDPVELAENYIKSHVDQELFVSELAETVGMNPEYLTRQFRKRYGHSLKEYIEIQKMEAAKMFLSTTDLPVTVAASHVGYSNYSNFSRAFKAFTGKTPVEYRKEVRK